MTDDNLDLDFLENILKRKKAGKIQQSKKRMKKERKHSYKAYWIIPSFVYLNIYNLVRTDVFFIGMHKSNVIKGQEFPATPTFAVIGETNREAMPMSCNDFTKLVASLYVASGNPDLHKEVKLRLERLSNNTDKLYTEFDFNTVSYERVKTIALKTNGEWKIPVFDQSNVSWLNHMFSYFIRIGPEHNEQIQQMLLVGRDVYNNIPVIALIKPRYNFYYCVPLIDKGLSTLLALESLIYLKPNEEIAISSPVVFEQTLAEEINNLQYEGYASFQIKIPLNEMVKKLTSSNK